MFTGADLTIDEMLESFRGRCSFRQYLPSKAAKYGIKMFALVDSETYFTNNLKVYVGTQPEGLRRVDNDPASIVLRLTEHIHGTGRNITCDNWFTSYNLVEQLVERN